MEKEVRTLAVPPQAKSEGRTIQGMAVRFGERSELLRFGDISFYEVIDKRSITQEVVNNSDIKALVNHSYDRLIGRSNKGQGSLRLELREEGLAFSVEAPHTATGDEALELVRRGDISGCSFGFWDVESEWSKLEDGTHLRTITRIGALDDVSIVVSPAYVCTEVSVRQLTDKTNPAEEPQAEEPQAEEPQAEEPQAEADLSVYYNELESEI